MKPQESLEVGKKVAQERSAPAKYFTEFNPEKFAEEFTKKMMAETAQQEGGNDASTASGAENTDDTTGVN
ncbi:hypothetical protein CMUST_11195 [Corynebacterium mustelae]|uniref:Uncharacterized protein n=1 Tax=Corynebacterium mustelae TaxID=571915 RepID=A0A0G3GZF3_9CORY|nr:hypothetical protein [Corynebacterium mustelae]AKK06554.1 hypothetical protein CMUST_11195 [Corynebacterium mustelae]